MVRGLLSSGTAERPDPERLLELYSMEGCGACRKVRQRLTELDIDYVHRSCPLGSQRNRAFVAERGGKMQFPFLVDPNAGVQLYESDVILDYLNATYGCSPESVRAMV